MLVVVVVTVTVVVSVAVSVVVVEAVLVVVTVVVGPGTVWVLVDVAVWVAVVVTVAVQLSDVVVAAVAAGRFVGCWPCPLTAAKAVTIESATRIARMAWASAITRTGLANARSLLMRLHRPSRRRPLRTPPPSTG